MAKYSLAGTVVAHPKGRVNQPLVNPTATKDASFKSLKSAKLVGCKRRVQWATCTRP